MAVFESSVTEGAGVPLASVSSIVPLHEPIGVRIARLKSEISDRDVQIALLKAQKVELRNQLAKLSGRD